MTPPWGMHLTLPVAAKSNVVRARALSGQPYGFPLCARALPQPSDVSVSGVGRLGRPAILGLKKFRPVAFTCVGVAGRSSLL